jgi:Bacterial Ig domain
MSRRIPLILSLLFAMTLHAQFVFNPTTTVTRETSNNTSASTLFTDIYNRGSGNFSNGDAAVHGRPAGQPGDTNGAVSKLSVHNLLYAHHTTKIYVETQSWFCHNTSNENPDGTLDPARSVNSCRSPHVDIGYTSTLQAKVNDQVADMESRGIDGLIFNWNDNATDNSEADMIRTAAEASGGRFHFAIMVDKNAVGTECGSTNCAQAAIDMANIILQRWAGSSAYIKDANNTPLIFYFVDHGTTPNSLDANGGSIWPAVKSAIGNRALILPDKVSGFESPDGAFGWVDYNPTRDPSGVKVLGDYYFTATNNHPSQISVGAAFKGFDDHLAVWGKGHIDEQQCGMTWLNTFAETNKFYSTSRPLPWLQIVTWDDYEEGTEIETGIDNCMQRLDRSLSGSLLTWSAAFGTDPNDAGIRGNETTVHHYQVYLAQAGSENLMLLADNIPTTQHSLDLAQYGITPGNYVVYVKAVGQPSILNHLSDGIPYTVSGSNCMVQITAPANGAGVTSPVQVSATITPSVPGAAVSTAEIDLDGAMVITFQQPQGGAISWSLPINTTGNHTITVGATDTAGGNCASSVTVNVQSTATNPDYAADFNAVSQWLTTVSKADGAITLSDGSINPYFGNLAAIGMTKDSNRYGQVERWMSWYAAHLNNPDKWGLSGTIYDYTSAEAPTNDADSTDSYAATFVSLAWNYYNNSHGAAAPFLQGLRPQIDMVAGVLTNEDLLPNNLRQRDPADHLTYAKPDYPIKYLMDNAEVYRGLRDAASLYALAFNDQTRASFFSQQADIVQNAINTKLFNSADNSYYTFLGAPTVDWTSWYTDPSGNPAAVAELFPALQGVIDPNSTLAANLYNRFNASFPNWPNAVQDPGDYPWVLVGYTAALMKDAPRANDFIRMIEQQFIAHDFANPPLNWNDEEAGWFLLLASFMQGNPPPNVLVSISTPANGATVATPFTLNASATSNSAIASWQVLVDGIEQATAGAVSSISTTLSPTAGTHTITVNATDVTGATGSQSITVTAAATISVTVSSPANGAVVTSPVTINASATSSHLVTGWHIYVDGIDSFSAGQVSSISASLALAPGLHTVIVRAWDSSGAFADQTLSLNVAAGVTVSVSSPANNSTVGTSATVSASATSSNTITGWHVYVDGVDSFSAGQVSSISAPLTLAVGAHTIVVRAWDSSGAFGDQTLSVTAAKPVSVSVSAPANGATVGSPVTIAASAASSHVITGWHIYVDSVDSFSAGQTASINASLAMGVGTHTVIVRAWDSTGAYGDQTLTLHVAGGVTVHVSSPANNATVATPVTIAATATSGNVITGWHIYVDGVDSFSAGQASSINASVNLSAGTHTVIVRAWDSSGAFGSQTLTLTASAGVSVTVSTPTNNASVASPVNIAASASSGHTITGWHIYVDGVDSFSAGQVSSINASVPMAHGTRTVIVRAWDSTGAYGDKTLTLSVQ